MTEKINDDTSGFAEMITEAPYSELDRLSKIVGPLSVDVDEIKRELLALAQRNSVDGPTPIVQSLMQLGQRVQKIEEYLNQRQGQETIQQQQLERHTRAQALDGAIKMCPPLSNDFALFEQAFDFCLRILRGAAIN